MIEVANPGPTPLGENPENALYRDWKNSSQDQKADIENRLLQHLRRHASKVCWMVLHTCEPHLIEDICADALMQLDSFKELSAFSTWFHSRARHNCHNFFRNRIRRREFPILDAQEPMASSELVETRILWDQLSKHLSVSEQELLELKIVLGLTDREVGKKLGVSRRQAQVLWFNLRNKLKDLV